LRIDHVIYGAADLEGATARLEELVGLPAVGGGRHDGLGTQNRIIALGGGYLEVLAVADADEAAASVFGRALSARLGSGEGLMGWAVAAGDVGAIARERGLEVTTIGREGMTARLAGVAEALGEPALPFFIERDAGIADPGAGGPGPGIGWLEVAGDASRLRTWLGGAELPLRVVDGAPEVLAVGVGDVVIR